MVETHSGRRLAVFVFAAAFLVFFLGRWLAPVDHVALAAAAPFQAVVSSVANTVGDVVTGVFDGPRLRDENQKLRDENSQLLKANILLQEQRHENALLKRMLRYADGNPNLKILPARVIGSDPNSLSPFIVVSKGSHDGLRQGMTVEDHHGYFVGAVTDVAVNSAKVQLMLSPSMSIGAIDLTTRAKGLVEGQYGSDPKLDNVVVSSPIHVGDLIVTSGDWNLYPRLVLLGQVKSISRKNVDLFQSADLQPAADFRDLEMVQIVRGFNPAKPNKLVLGP